MSLKKHKLTITLPYTILGLIVLCMVLTGCKLNEPSTLSQNRIQVEEEKFTDSVPVAKLNTAAVSGLARHYTKHGDGPLGLTVTYDPKSKTRSAMHASDEVARIVKELRLAGVSNVDSSILPVNGMSGEMNALISYMSYNALAPKDCGTIAGFGGSKVDPDESYKLGCTFDTVFARQIARPKDLKGQSNTDRTTDGRRSGNVIDVYRSGIPNEPLDGESATEE